MAVWERTTRISEAEAVRKAQDHLLAGTQLTPVRYPGSMHLADDPAGLWFFRIDRAEMRAGGDEIVAVRQRNGTIAFRGVVGE